jgi:hypothetical protein
MVGWANFDNLTISLGITPICPPYSSDFNLRDRLTTSCSGRIWDKIKMPGNIRLLAEVRQQATGNRQQWEELEFFGIKLI